MSDFNVGDTVTVTLTGTVVADADSTYFCVRTSDQYPNYVNRHDPDTSIRVQGPELVEGEFYQDYDGEVLRYVGNGSFQSMGNDGQLFRAAHRLKRITLPYAEEEPY